MKQLLALLLLLLPSAALRAQDNANFEASKMLEIFNRLYVELHLNYVDTLKAEKAVGGAIDYMLAQLDPYGEFYIEERTEELRTMTTGQYAGIGAGIRHHKAHRRCAFDVPSFGMPAHKAGVRMGDVILRIDGKDVGEIGQRSTSDYTSTIVQQLRGAAGSSFILTVQRPGVKRPIDLRITRGKIVQPSVIYSNLYTDGTAIIVLTGYTEGTAKEVKEALVALKEKGAKRLILDLRSNGGGLVEEAVKLVNLFVPQNKLVLETRGRDQEVRQRYLTTGASLDEQMPIVVLVDGQTASSAEITAGTLQDYDRAVVMGNRTYGKGLVQSSRQLPYGAILKFTSARYYIPSGRCIQAYDFKQEGAEGRPLHLPDSLAKTFHTESGRPVKDGGGILPDVVLPIDSLPTLIGYLRYSDQLFDYCVDYTHRHKTVAPPTEFALTDAEFEAFKVYMEKAGFTYNNMASRVLDQLKQVAKSEGYAQGAAAQIAALEAQLTHHLSTDLEIWKKAVKREVESTIIEHYYGTKGRAEYLLHHDNDLKAAINLLHTPSKYKKLLGH